MTDRVVRGENRGVGWSCVRARRYGMIELDSPFCQRIDEWRGRAWVAVAAEVVGSQGIDRDKNNVVEKLLTLTGKTEA